MSIDDENPQCVPYWVLTEIWGILWESWKLTKNTKSDIVFKAAKCHLQRDWCIQYYPIVLNVFIGTHSCLLLQKYIELIFSIHVDSHIHPKICKNWIIVYHKLWLTNNRTMKIYARCLHCAGKNFNSVADRNAWRWSQTLSVCMNRMMIFDGAMAFISCMKLILLCVWMWQFASLGGEHHFIIIILNESWRIPLRMYAREWEQPLHNTIEMSAR